MDQILLECKQGRLTAHALTSYAVSTPGLLQYKDREGVSLLHWVSLRGDLELLDACLTFGADVNILTPQLQTPLMWAAIHGHTGVIQQLFSSGSDLNLRDSLGATSLVLASQHGQVRSWLQLCDLGADPRLGDGRGCTSAHWAAYSGHTDLLRVLNRRSREMLSEVDNDGWTPLHRASRAGSFECVAFLVGEVGLHPCVQQAGVCPPPFSTAPIHTPLAHSEESLRAEAAGVMAATQALEAASANFKAQAQRHPSPQSMAAMQAMGAAQEALARAQRRHGGLKAVVAFLSQEETWRNEVALGGLKGAWAWGTACLRALFASKFASGRGLYPLITAAIYVYALLAVFLWVAPPFFSLFFFLAPVGVYSALCLHAGVGEGWRAHSCGGVVVGGRVGGMGEGGGGAAAAAAAAAASSPPSSPQPLVVAFEEDRWTSINPIRLTLAAVSQFSREGVVTREGCSSALRGEGGGTLRHILLSVVSGGGWLQVGRSLQRMLASSGLVGGGRGQGSDPVEPSNSSSASTSSASGGGEGDVEEGRGLLGGEGVGGRRGANGGGDVWAHLHRVVVAVTPLALTIRAWLIESSPSALSTIIERLALWLTLLPFLKVHNLPPPIPSLATFNPQAFTTALTRAIADAPPPTSTGSGGEGEGRGEGTVKTPTQVFLDTAGALALEDKMVLSASTSSSSSSSSSGTVAQQPPPPSPLPLHTFDHTHLLIHPLRATHCPVAGKVYSRYDHFSFPLGVPIGAGNHRAYMALLVINWVLCLQLALGTLEGASRHAAMNALLIQESALFNAAHSVTPNSFSAVHLAELRANLPVSTWGVFWGGNWFAHLFSLLLFSSLFFRLTGAVLTQARHLAANITLYEASTLPSHPTFLSLQWSPSANQIIPAFYNPFSKTTPLDNVEDGLQGGGVSPLIPLTTTPPLPPQLMDPLAAKVRFLQAQQLRATAEVMAKHMEEMMGGGGRGGGGAPSSPPPTTTPPPQREQNSGGGESLEDMPSVPTGNLQASAGGGGRGGVGMMPKMQPPSPDMLVSRVTAMQSSYHASGAYAKLFLAPPHATHGQGGGGGGHSHGGRGGGGGHSHGGGAAAAAAAGGGHGAHGHGGGGGGGGGGSGGGGHSHGGRECHGHH